MRRLHTGLRAPVAILCSTLVLACETGSGDSSSLVVQVDTVGDTVHVHTASGSAWGAARPLTEQASIGVLNGAEHEMLGQVAALAVGRDGTIYVTDRQANTLRAFDADGGYVGTLATEGAGPGELGGPDGGLAVLTDGRIAVRDPSNQRIQLFGEGGNPAGTWRLPTGLQTSDRMYLDTEGVLWSPTVLDLSVPVGEWERGFLRYRSNGDTLSAVGVGVPEYNEAHISASVEGSTSQQVVPFAPRQRVRINPDGERVNAVAVTDAFDVHRKDGRVLRVSRARDPVSVQRGEANARERSVARNFRNMDPDWSWNGPRMPETKAPYEDVYVGLDGRYWVSVATPGVETNEPMWEAEPGEPDAPMSWDAPIKFDVFEPDGRYLGAVETPEGFSIYPTPVFRGDEVWAVATDDLDVQRVVRYRLDAYP